MAASGGYWKGGTFNAMPKPGFDRRAELRFVSERGRVHAERERDQLRTHIDRDIPREEALTERLEGVRREVRAMGDLRDASPGELARVRRLRGTIRSLEERRSALAERIGTNLNRERLINRRLRGGI